MFAHCLFVVFVLCCSTENQGRIYVPGKTRCSFSQTSFYLRLDRLEILKFPPVKMIGFLSAFGVLKNDYVKLTLSGFQDKRSNVSSLINVLPKLYVHIFYFFFDSHKVDGIV